MWWVLNEVRMFDDGSHGDLVANDSIWTLEVQLPAGLAIEYKHTNGGPEGRWGLGGEFAGANRKFRVQKNPSGKMVIRNRFGMM